MNIQKLFHVLVVGGALMSSGYASDTAEENSLTEGPKLQSVFCTSESEKVCEKDKCGNAKVKDGFECCWGTSCDNL